MGDAPVPGRTRDADRSREAILDAAEALFAERGYEGTTLQEIGRAAGVSRGTPGYFFGSKERLYAAVLERAFAAELKFVGQAQARAAQAGGGPEAELAAVVASFLEFLAARPAFVRLLDREALAGGRLLNATPAHVAALEGGLATTRDLLVRVADRPVDPAHFLLDVLALCWFPVAHADTFARGLGLDPADPAFAAARARHVVDLLLRGLRAG
jgi:AcrR family transcriptional regulator